LSICSSGACASSTESERLGQPWGAVALSREKEIFASVDWVS
jgi:hypothetical protein